MTEIEFTKVVASGNDFVIVHYNPPTTHLSSSGPFSNQKLSFLAKRICDRKFGIGADGLLLLENSKNADIKMRIFNPDGTEAKMCGNGLRCVALYEVRNKKQQARNLKIETKAGVIEAELNKDFVKIKMPSLKNLELDIPIKINDRLLKVNFVDTGVPHAVIFVEGLEGIDVLNLGRRIRKHKKFQPEGTNVDFVEILNKDSIKIRTYERGVENETLSCGTGAVASAIITNLKTSNFKLQNKINVHTKSGEVLKVYFERTDDKFKNIWLEGKARIVYKGVYYV